MVLDDYADIHAHLVYGVDDGSQSLEESLELLQIAHREGIRFMFATPHYGAGNVGTPEASLLRERFTILKARARERVPEMELYLGAELFYTPDLLELLEAGKALPLNGTRYILVEFAEWKGRSDPAEHITQTMLGLAQSRWLPILAHAQRYRDYSGKFHLYEQMVNGGVYLQINAYDLFDTQSEDTKEKARWLVQHRLAHFLGTDTHRLDHHPPVMRSGVNYLYQTCDEAYADALVSGNAKKLLRDETISLRFQ